jgi:hypothetical protein
MKNHYSDQNLSKNLNKQLNHNLIKKYVKPNIHLFTGILLNRQKLNQTFTLKNSRYTK